jgi:hypothetical protein
MGHIVIIDASAVVQLDMIAIMMVIVIIRRREIRGESEFLIVSVLASGEIKCMIYQSKEFSRKPKISVACAERIANQIIKH